MADTAATPKKTIVVNGREVEFTTERNLLEVIRKVGIDIPTFCYHSELSIYGACRLCLVEVTIPSPRGDRTMVMASCSTAPTPGMIVRTDTKELRAQRKVTVELLLANHNCDCPTCARSSNCQLQNIARQLGVSEVRYKKLEKFEPIDRSSAAIERDPNKCVLCGDCVRVCRELEGVGCIDFVNRGSDAKVAPSMNGLMKDAECVNCGQCVQVCPTGALIPRQNRDEVWDALYNTDKTVVVSVAPAVRVALGEYFNIPAGEDVAGKLVAALHLMGFKHVYDTSFTADMTIFEEGTEFLQRVSDPNAKLPMFTSCCPAWVKFCETYYPEMLPNLSTARSPQGMYGSVAKTMLPALLGCKREDMYVVSIMPCTAKKFEAQLAKFKVDGQPEIDAVITTSEVARMISSMGIHLNELEPEAFDMPMGFATGAGVIFGTTGGVMEAALRFAVEKLENKPLMNVEFTAVRGLQNRKVATLHVAGKDITVCVVYGLAAAREVVEDIKAGTVHYDFVEVMACPGGCISGGGQPVGTTTAQRKARMAGMYRADKAHQVQKSQDNFEVTRAYERCLGGAPGSHEAHELLHTEYQNRSQIFDARIPVIDGQAEQKLPITVTICTQQKECPGQLLLGKISDYVKEAGYADKVKLEAAFSSRPDEAGTVCVTVGDLPFERTNFVNATSAQEEEANCAAFQRIKGEIDAAMKSL